MSEKSATIEEKELTVAQERALSTNVESFETGLEDDTSAPSIPRVSLVQEKTKDIGAEFKGNFYIKLTGDMFKNMIGVPLKFFNTRSLFPKSFDYDNEPLCKSDDFKKPAASIEAPKCDTCEPLPGYENSREKVYKCAFANWTEDPENPGKKLPPRCSEVANYIMLDMATFLPCILSCQKLSLKQAHRLNKALKLLCQARRKPMWHFCTDIAVIEDPKNKGIFIPSFNNIHIIGSDMDQETQKEFIESMNAAREAVKNYSAADIKEELRDEASSAKEEEEAF